MTSLSQDTYFSQNTLLSALGSGGGPNPTFSTITVSSATVTGELVATYIQAGQVSSIFLDAEEVGCSSISTLSMVLDGNTLTSVGTELLLNGIPLATTSSLSSIADWSLDPAISTLNMNSNRIIGATGYEGTGVISTTDIIADSAAITRLVCTDISTMTLTALSTIEVVSTISTMTVLADNVFATNISSSDISTNTLTVQSTVQVGGRIDSLKMFAGVANFGDTFTSTLTTSSITTSSINGAQFPQVIPPQTVPSTLTGPNTFVLADQGSVPATANANIRAQGGLGGNVNIRADPGAAGVSGGSVDLQAFGGTGLAGLYGAVRLTAYEGTDVTSGITTGGLIQLQANSGGALSNATSAIKFSGGSVVSYAGAANPAGSLFGYNYMYGTVGASITASILPPTVNTPGTVYLYGDTGVVIGSDMYASRLFGYWDGLATPSNLFLAGRQTIFGNSYVVLSNVQNMYMDNGAISGVNTINGTSYPPPPFVPSANPELSTITINPTGYISTAVIEGVSSINGEAYPPNVPGLDPNIELSTLIMNATGYITTAVIEGVSSINGAAYPPPLPEIDANLEISTLMVNATGYISTAVIEGVSSINGQVYPPPLPEIDANLEISTLMVNAAGYISTLAIEGLSTINGVAYPPATSPELQLSTLIINTTGSISTIAIIGLSTINNEAYPPVASVPAELSVSSLTIGSPLSRLTFISGLDGDVGEIIGLSSINGTSYPPPAGNVEDWATFPAIRDVDLASNSIYSTNTVHATYVSTNNILGSVNTAINLGQATAGAINLYHDALAGSVNIMLSGTAAPGSLITGDISTMYLETSTINGQSVNTLNFSSIDVAQSISTPILAWDGTVARLDGGNITLAPLDNVIVRGTRASSSIGTIEVGALINGEAGVSTVSMNLGTAVNGLLDIRTANAQILTAGSGPSQLNVASLSTISSINGREVTYPLVSSMQFGPVNLPSNSGCINTEGGLIFNDIGSGNPAMTYSFSVITPIEPGALSNEIVLIEPSAGSEGNTLIVHVSDTDISINANTIASGFTPARLNIRASTVHMSSLYVSSINGVAYAGRPSVYASTSNVSAGLSSFSQSTAQTVIAVTVPVSEACNLQITGTATAQNDTSSRTDIFFFVTVDDAIVGFPYSDTLEGASHYGTFSVTGTAIGATAGSKVVALKAFGEPGSNYLLSPYQISVISNLA